jgi:hypothetical protein
VSPVVENLIERLDAKRSGGGWKAKCPSHEDRIPSLSIDEGREGCVLLKCHAGCSIDDIVNALGLTKRDLFPESLSPYRGNGNGATPFDWQSCVNAFTAKHSERLCAWRGFAPVFVSRLLEKRLVGVSDKQIAFPVQDGDKIIAAHVRTKAGGWFFHPKGLGTRAFILGDLAKSKQIHLFESQWDLLAFADRSELYLNEHHAFIATRGASNAGLLKGLLPAGASVLAWPQNDKPGQQWLAHIPAYINTKLATAVTPQPHKDLNEWTLAGATAEDLFGAFWRNELVHEPKAEAEAIQ